MLSTERLEAPAPPSVIVCDVDAPTLSPDDSDALVKLSGAGIGALTFLVIAPSSRRSVPVDALDVGVYVRETCVVGADGAVGTVPDPLTRPDVEETDHETPGATAVSVVAVTLVAAPTAAKSGEKLTVVGNL